MKSQTALVVGLLVMAAAAQGAVRYVPSQYSTIQAAINASVAGDVVQVAPGTYTDLVIPNPGDTCVVAMKSGITLRGSGAGATRINGLHRSRGIHCDGVTNAVIEELTVTNCFAAVHGSGILCRGGSTPTIRNCEITRNYDGGIICYQSSSPAITNVAMTYNAAKEGGGLAIDTDCSPTVTDCTIRGNKAPGGGGILVRASSAPTIIRCVVDADSIDTSSGSGGGILVNNSSPTIQNCSFINCVSTAGGGGVYTTEATMTMTGCLVQGNRTLGDYAPGGGLFLDFNSDVTLQGCTITRNFQEGFDPATDGAGISAHAAAQVIVRQCTIAFNGTTAGVAGGIEVQNTGVFTLDKSIIAFSNPGAAMVCTGSTPTVGCTDLYGNQGGNTICGTNVGHNFSLDPLFCDATNNDFRLQSPSPCLPGQHPDGPAACDGSQIGSQGQGCAPLGVDPSIGSGSARLIGNEPNPFRPATTIHYTLARTGHVTLRIYDVAGREVRGLEDRVLEAGAHNAIWDGRSDAGTLVPSGVYFYRLSVDGKGETRHMVLAR